MTELLLAGILFLLAYIAALIEANTSKTPRSSNWHTSVTAALVLSALAIGFAIMLGLNAFVSVLPS